MLFSKSFLVETAVGGPDGELLSASEDDALDALEDDDGAPEDSNGDAPENADVDAPEDREDQEGKDYATTWKSPWGPPCCG